MAGLGGQGFGGIRLITADTAITTVPTRVWMIHILSGASAGEVSLRNGGTGDTIHVVETGTANTGRTITYGEQGVLFPAGLALTEDTAPTSTLVVFSTEV